jgi:hypothetical protein
MAGTERRVDGCPVTTIRVALAALAIGTIAPSTALASRWSESDAQGALLAKTWPAHGIAVDAECLALDGQGISGATRFVCKISIAVPPATVSLPTWSRVAAAIRSRDQARIRHALGIRSDASQTDVDSIVHEWGLDKPHTRVTGLRVAGPKRVALLPSPLTIGRFQEAERATAGLRDAVPALEAYYTEHGTYAGVTIAALARIDDVISRRIMIGSASERGYCVSLTVGKATWSYSGPGGQLRMNGCG